MSDEPKPVPPPKEGSNRGQEPTDQKRANISEAISRRHPKGGDNEIPKPDKSDRKPQK
jgi:hypothetical protein